MNCNLLIIVAIVVLAIIFVSSSSSENLCVQRDYGLITDVPASDYRDANIALVENSTLGQAPLGNPQHWIPDRSPITQGQWGLYQGDGLESAMASNSFPRYD